MSIEPAGASVRFADEGSRTLWVASRLDLVGKLIGRPLSLVTAECAVHSLSADIVALDDKNEIVVIELQRGGSDHKHLGQIITYLAELKAECGVWIADSFGDRTLAGLRSINNQTSIRIFPVLWSVGKDGEPMLAPANDLPALLGQDAAAGARRLGAFWQQFEAHPLEERASSATLIPAGRGARLLPVDRTKYAIRIAVDPRNQVRFAIVGRHGAPVEIEFATRALLVDALRDLKDFTDPHDHWGLIIDDDQGNLPAVIRDSWRRTRRLADEIQKISGKQN